MSDTNKSRFRIASIIFGVLVLAMGLFYVLNTSAEPSQASDDTDQETTAEETDEAKDGEEDDEDGKKDNDGEDGEDEEDEKTPIPVKAVDIQRGSVAAFISATANLVAEQDVKVLAEAEGRIVSLSVEEGDRVEKGQVLAELIHDDAQIALEKSRLTLTNAELAYNRSKEMFQQELISQEEHDRLKMELEIAQQEVAEAQYRLGKTTIRAPFTGLITERMVQVGHHIRLGDELYSVADFDPLVARIYLPERDILGLEAKRAVRISLQADDSIIFKGRIRQISPVVDVATGTVKVTVEAIEPPREVRPGAFVTIDIERERHAEVVLLPRESVIRELQNSHVFVADGEVARKRPVTLGLEEGEVIEALTGVEEGEQVIIAGQGGLKDGEPVKVIQVADAELGG